MRIPLIGKILIGFVLGTAIGLAFSEFCAPETTAKVLPWIAPFGMTSVFMNPTLHARTSPPAFMTSV